MRFPRTGDGQTINALIVSFDDQGVYLRFLGGAEGTRTPDPHTASVVRYQLRHGPQRPVPLGTRAIVHTRGQTGIIEAG